MPKQQDYTKLKRIYPVVRMNTKKRNPPIANSLLKCNFEGTVTIETAFTSPQAGSNPSRNFLKNISGTDSNNTVWPTSFENLFGSGVKTQIQTIPSENITGANDAEKILVLDTLATNEIRSLGTPVNGVKKYLHTELTSRTIPIGDTPAPQTDPAIIRAGSATTDITNLCIRKVIRLPPNLNDLLVYPTPSNANWLIVDDFKTGNYLGQNGKGDYRFKLQILKDGTGLYWRIGGDNSANGHGIIPSLEADNNGTGGFWQIAADNTQVPVFLNEWLEIYTFIHRPETYWTRETPGDENTPYVRDTTTGRTIVVMKRLSTGKYYLIGDQVGDIQMGSENCIWTRLFFLTYCNANTPVYIQTLEFEFYDNLPFTLSSVGL